MNGFEMLTGPLAQSIGWALVHLLWQGIVIAALLAAVLALMEKRSANARYLAACGALVLLLACAVVTAYRAYDPSIELPTAPPSIAFSTPPAIDFAAATASSLPPVAAGDAAPAAHTRWLPLLRAALPQIVLVWMAGVLLLSLRLLTSWLRAMRMAGRDALHATPEWQRTVNRLASGLGLRRAVRLVESAAVEVPTVIGWMRPVILLPLSSLSGLSAEQVEMVLAHELAHIRRHDFFVNLLQAVVETLLFYHPAVWWMSNRVRVERENCCDDLAVAVCGNALQYARALTRLEELRAGDVQVAVAANGGSLIERIRRLVGARAEGSVQTSRWIAGAGVLTLLLALIAFPSLPLLAQREEKKAPAPAKAAQAQVEVRPETTTDMNADDDDESADDDSDNDSSADDDHDASAEDDRDGNDADVNVDDVDYAAMMPAVPPTPGVPPAPVVAGVPPAPAVAGVPPAPPAAPAWAAAPAAPAPPAPGLGPLPVLHRKKGDILDERTLKLKIAEAMERRERRHHPIGEGGQLSVDDLITLSSVGVTPQYIGEMRAAFGPSLTLDDVVAMRTQGVTTTWLREMKAAGVNIRTGDEAVSLAVQGVKPAFVRELAAAGYTNLSVDDLVRLAVSGVNADYIREMAKYRTDRKK